MAFPTLRKLPSSTRLNHRTGKIESQHRAEVEIPMNIIDYPLNPGQWVAKKTPKACVVWHGTRGRTAATPYNGQPGQATSSIDYWNSNTQRVGAPWLVDRDGTIYRTFDDREWIVHLGIGTDYSYEQATVGIEIANELDLIATGGQLYAFGEVKPNTRYIGKHFVQKWRGGEYWASMDEAQVDACIELTLDICERFSIDPVFYYPSTNFDADCFTKAQIICHSNCRQDKLDLLLEDWVWDKIQAAGITLSS
jgi:hypothetical protein